MRLQPKSVPAVSDVHGLPLNNIDFRNLETFVAVAQSGKFILAAEKLNTTQPAVSARIALLENNLGARLFDRRPRHAELTTAGLKLLAYAEKMLALRAEIEHAFGDASGLNGILRLGVPETIVHTWLTPLVERIAQQYPEVTLDIEVDSTPNLYRALISEKLDVAFLYQPGSADELCCKPLCSYELGWFAGSDFPLPQSTIPVEKLAAWPIITFRRGSPSYTAIGLLFEAMGLTDGRIFGSSAIAAIIRMTLNGIGVCVLPNAVVQDELRDKRLRRLDVDCVLPPLDFYVCFRPKSVSPLNRIVTDIAIATAKSYQQRTLHT